MLTEVHAMARLIVVALLLCLPAAVPAAAPQAGGSGESIYLRHCARCHQSNGTGIDGLYPGLRDLPAEGAPRREAIRGLLAGRLGELEVGGVTLDNPMRGHPAPTEVEPPGALEVVHGHRRPPSVPPAAPVRHRF